MRRLQAKLAPAENIQPAPTGHSELAGILQRIGPYDALGNHERMIWHYRLGRYVVIRGVPDDFVECGVYKSASAATIALDLQNSGPHIFWRYNSFE